MLLQARSFRQMKLRDEYTCPLELIHDMIKGKWKPIILWRLRLGATSLSKLENDIDGITQNAFGTFKGTYRLWIC